jgi:pantoate kinase
MTANIKNFNAARTAITSLGQQIAAEFKADPRFKRADARAKNLLRILGIMQERYELVHSRKVPAKVQAKKAGAKKAAPKKAAKKAAKSNVVQMKAAAASRKSSVKRSK